MNKNFYILIGVVIVILAAGAGWYYFYSKSLDKYPGKVGDQNTLDAASTSEHFKVTPLTKEFIIEENSAAMYGGQKVTLTSPEDLPASTSLKNFSYDQTKGESIKISGSCSDAYYAIVIFRGADDYKQKADSAVFNQAFACPDDKKFTRTLQLKDYNLLSGEYYFFVADQGKTGAWYNPR